jgi:hypothetical protein
MSEVLDQPAGWFDELVLRVGFLLTVTSLILAISASMHLGVG